MLCGYTASLIILLGIGILAIMAPARTNWLLSIVILAGIVNVICIALYVRFIQTELQQPLSDMADWAGEIRQGNLRARLVEQPHSSSGLIDDVNRASEWLEALADDMEGQLELQRKNLESKTRSLQLLYDVVRGINFATEVENLISRLMHTSADAVGAKAASARLKNQVSELPIAELNFDSSLTEVEKFCVDYCDPFSSEVDIRMDRVLDDMRSAGYCPDASLTRFEILIVPLQYLSVINGVYFLFIERGKISISDDVRELLVSIGRQLGMAIERARLESEVGLAPRVRERMHLANELHDSLAQTLASLKFQVRVLDEMLRHERDAVVWTELERIEAGIKEANIEVRELITHFRAPIYGGGLIPAIQSALLRFRKETKIETYFHNEWDDVTLESEEEINVLRIVTESLANIRKHSAASNVRVLLRNSGTFYRLLIEDDGCGFDPLKAVDVSDQHYGLSIMQERAAVIDGSLQVESETGEGTRVMLEFIPVQSVRECINACVIDR